MPGSDEAPKKSSADDKEASVEQPKVDEVAEGDALSEEERAVQDEIEKLRQEARQERLKAAKAERARLKGELQNLRQRTAHSKRGSTTPPRKSSPAAKVKAANGGKRSAKKTKKKTSLDQLRTISELSERADKN